MAVLTQVICTLIASYLGFSLGLSFAWPSSMITSFTSTNTTLDRPMGDTEIALFGSLSSIGALIGNPIVGFCLDIIGRKNSAIVTSIMSVLAWTMISVSNKVEVILIAMFISGVGGAAGLVVPLFVGEICQESIRGMMMSATMIFYAVGMLVSYVIGSSLDYNVMVYVCLTLTIFGVMMLLFLKESPMYLMKKGLEEEAQKSFAFYRRASFNSKIVLQEMEKLRRAFNPELEGEEVTSPEEEKLNKGDPEKKPQEKLSLIQFIKKSRSTRRAIVVTLTLCTASIFQGLAVVQVYAEPVFKEAVPNVSSTLCSVILAICTIVSGIIAAYLTDVFGRRPLMIYGSLGTGACCVALGAQLHAQWGPHWLTALLIYAYTVLYTCGAGTVPFVFLAEVFLPEVRSIMSMVVIEWAWLCNFIVLFVFHPLVTVIGLGPVFYLFAGVCVLSAAYCIFFQPETKGVTVDVIQARFLPKRKEGH